MINAPIDGSREEWAEFNSAKNTFCQRVLAMVIKGSNPAEIRDEIESLSDINVEGMLVGSDDIHLTAVDNDVEELISIFGTINETDGTVTMRDGVHLRPSVPKNYGVITTPQNHSANYGEVKIAGSTMTITVKRRYFDNATLDLTELEDGGTAQTAIPPRGEDFKEWLNEIVKTIFYKSPRKKNGNAPAIIIDNGWIKFQLKSKLTAKPRGGGFRRNLSKLVGANAANNRLGRRAS